MAQQYNGMLFFHTLNTIIKLGKKQDNLILKYTVHINIQNEDWNKNTTILLIDIMFQ